MDQSQGGNPFGRLIEFARPHKTGYIVSVVLAVLGVAFGMKPWLAVPEGTCLVENARGLRLPEPC